MDPFLADYFSSFWQKRKSENEKLAGLVLHSILLNHFAFPSIDVLARNRHSVSHNCEGWEMPILLPHTTIYKPMRVLWLGSEGNQQLVDRHRSASVLASGNSSESGSLWGVRTHQLWLFAEIIFCWLSILFSVFELLFCNFVVHNFL